MYESNYKFYFIKETLDHIFRINDYILDKS